MAYKMTTRRKLAIASWSSPREGNIYGKLSLDMGEVLKYLEHLRKTSGERVTVTHFVGRAVGVALAQSPDINGRIVFGKYKPHKTADVAFLVTLEDGNDLAKVKICDIDKKTTVEIARELRQRAEALRRGGDIEFQKSKPLLKLLPTWMIRPILWSIGYLTAAIGVSVKPLGLEAFPFGACIITSVGMLGIDEGFAPPTPFARVPVYVVVPKVVDRVVAIDGEIVVRPKIDLLATIDHRFLDGHQGAKLANIVRNIFENPWLVDGIEKPLQIGSPDAVVV